MKTTTTLFALLAGMALAACGGGNSDNPDMTTTVTRDLTMVTADLTMQGPVDMAMTPTGPDFGCYPAGGSKHVQIINACTTDTRTAVDKTTNLPLLGSDGGCNDPSCLPPLQ